ncbi:MAG: Cell wall hydrolase/autolysin [Symbiobacteriaceae bacterium]|jgi:N-acetylmuramoyl-L-alanine amidase|nr:Cell wall hydrolase/autolysin [Symbiobacteriaceae bacterium]
MIEIQNIKFPKILLLMLLGILTVSLWAPSARAEVLAQIRVTVEGQPLEMPVPPVIVEDRTLVGLRSVGEAVGGELTWNQATRQATVTRGSDTIVVTVGSKQALVNGQVVELQIAPQIVNDRTMVPLRFIVEALGGTVEWDPATRTAHILRKPTAITGMTYTNGADKGRVVLTLSEPLLSVMPKVTGNDLTLDLYPATITATVADRQVLDGLVSGLRLAADGRTVRLTAQLWNTPMYRYLLSPDGRQLTVEFDHTVTGYQVQQDKRIAMVNIGLTGRVSYTHFPVNSPAPARIVLDLPDVHLSANAPELLELDNPYVSRIRAADKGAEGVRIVLDLKVAASYEVIPTDGGLRVQILPRIETIRTEQLQGVTRLSINASLPMDAKVTAYPELKLIQVEIPQGRSALPANLLTYQDGTINTVTVSPGAAPNSSLVTIALPYYLGHTLVSKAGDPSVIIDLVSSPILGKRIWIDAGHGRIPGAKDDPGSIGKTYGTYEKVVNLQVALELQKRLQAAGAIVYMTRTGDEGLDFTQRPALVNAVKPAVDLFISVHHNSSTNATVRGIETYYWTTNPKSRLVAQKLHPAILRGLGFPDRKIRQDAFYVIKETKAPSVLLELGYLSNAAEEAAIAEPGVVVKTYPAKAAEAIKNGIFDYFWQEIKAAVAN